MKSEYFPDTDSLYVDLSPNPSVRSVEVTDGVVIDYDAAGHIVGIDIDQASRKIDLQPVELQALHQ